MAIFSQWNPGLDTSAPPVPRAPVFNPASGPGWHGPVNPVASGNFQSRYGSASVRYPNFGGAPMLGAKGPSGGATGAPDYTAPVESTGDEAAPDSFVPPQNAMQRWSNPSQLKQLSPQTRYFWATGRIDARAPMATPPSGLDTGPSRDYKAVQFNNSPSNWNTGGSAPVQFNNEVAGHSDWQPY